MKRTGYILSGAGLTLALLGAILWLGWLDGPMIGLISAIFHKLAADRWGANLHSLGRILFFAGLALAVTFRWVLPRLPRAWSWLQRADQVIE